MFFRPNAHVLAQFFFNLLESLGRSTASPFQAANITLVLVPDCSSRLSISSHLITRLLSGVTTTHFQEKSWLAGIVAVTLHLLLPGRVSLANKHSATSQLPSSGIEPETARHILSAFSTMYSVSNVMLTHWIRVYPRSNRNAIFNHTAVCSLLLVL